MARNIVELHRDRARSYYQTSEYRRSVEQLRRVLEDIRGKIQGKRVALDLEGVLINTPFHEQNLGEPIETEERVVRPLAQETLDAMAQMAETVIWTCASKDLPDKTLTSAGLKVPKKVSLVKREDFSDLLQSEYADEVDRRRKHLLKSPTAKISTEIRKMLEHDQFKIPSLLGVDYLFDDRADFHQTICSLLDFPEDVDRIIAVDVFSIRNPVDLEKYPRDTGLLETLRTFRGQNLSSLFRQQAIDRKRR